MASPTPGTPVATTFAASVTSMAVNMPATVSSGDRLLAWSSIRNVATWTTVPTGWTQLKLQAGGGAVGDLTVFEKVADGTEGGTTKTWIASTGTTAVWQVMRVTGAHASTASEVTSTNGDATSANPPALTPTGGSLDYLFIALASNGATGETTGFTAAPTNYTGLQTNGASSGGSTVNIASATRQLTATTDDPGTFTPSSNRFWAAATVAVYPAAASGGTTVTPGKLSLTLTTFAPTITTTANQTVTPALASLALTTFAPTVTASNNKLVTPGVVSLSITSFAPTVSVANNQTVVPGVINLLISSFAPTVTASDNKLVTPGVASLSLATFAPTVTASDAKLVTPGIASLTITTYAPTISVINMGIYTPDSLHLVLVGYAPTITATNYTADDSLTIIGYTDSLIIRQVQTDLLTIKDVSDSLIIRDRADSLTIRNKADSLRVTTTADAVTIR